MDIWTIGHSNHSLDAFLDLLHAHAIQAVADVRRFPGSRKWPHFSADNMAVALRDAGFDYHEFRDLGGRRKPAPDSRNRAWKSAGFRGYADYMLTSSFESAISRLLRLAASSRTTIMCAESVWWRCHRSLISDWLKARGHRVLHITGAQRAEEHPFTSAARVIDGTLSYLPVEGPTLFD